MEDVLALCRRVDTSMAESDRVRHLLKGIGTLAFNALVLLNPTTVTDIINYAERTKFQWFRNFVHYCLFAGIEKLYETIRKAMDAIESGTCLRFVKRTNEKDYIRIFKGKGCSSLVGRRGGAQPVSLGEGCSNVTLIEHELLHAAGFFHEHMRPDRDQYITIIKENIDPKYYPEFQKLHLGPHDNLVPFDTDSVMLYGGHAFAREPGLTTMMAKDGTVLIPIYNKTGLSDTDILSVNILYNCSN
ncbi:astacin-like metalloprotease toxin 5 [Dermacentor silvarum]|uniref:astacin-like metalloprotease toxin 5 n=1 Tax=Dermacentor silvarum TaxID=543639 RepID=UPI002101B4D7|nr:astacin-like metalloprotease toxin 5 [Dermacentor silvarum]